MYTQRSEWWVRVDRLYNAKEVSYYYLLPAIFYLTTFKTDREVKNEYIELKYLMQYITPLDWEI